METSLKPDKYKDVIIGSLKFLVKEKRPEVNAFSIMSNHIHLIFQIQKGYERAIINGSKGHEPRHQLGTKNYECQKKSA
ncbi:MAG: hypothetical protein H0W75_11985 [Chitinophagaceae bacterium]|nr:hypothetical protein [Chitinophagaceae bacterium]